MIYNQISGDNKRNDKNISKVHDISSLNWIVGSSCSIGFYSVWYLLTLITLEMDINKSVTDLIYAVESRNVFGKTLDSPIICGTVNKYQLSGWVIIINGDGSCCQ